MHAFILAGGFATRLWPLTEKRAKPLLPLAGKPIISYLTQDLPDDMPVTVSTNSVFRDAFEAWRQEQGKSNLRILIEDTAHDDHKLGALGATAQWIEQENIHDDILLLTGDNYCGFGLAQFIDTAKSLALHPLLAVHDVEDKALAQSFGTVVLGAGGNKVLSFEEKPREPKSTLISTGASFIPKEFLPLLVAYAKMHPDNVGGIFEEFLSKNIAVYAFVPTEGQWFDIGSFESYLRATNALVGKHVLSGEHSIMEQTECSGSVVLGKRCRVKNCTLENVVLFDECVIEDCDLRDCICDDGCILKGIDLQKKMLRRGTKLVRED